MDRNEERLDYSNGSSASSRLSGSSSLVDAGLGNGSGGGRYKAK